MPDLKLPDRTILLDGGMGRELRYRGVDVMTTIWSAKALIDAPQVVRQIHSDYIAAGADIITDQFLWHHLQNKSKAATAGQA